jgi:hypothetical protein
MYQPTKARYLRVSCWRCGATLFLASNSHFHQASVLGLPFLGWLLWWLAASCLACAVASCDVLPLFG